MRRTLALAVVLTVLAGAGVASVATAAPPERSSTLPPWGKGPAVTGGTGRFKRARGQLHETFLPTGQFRFAFTFYL